MLKQIGELTPGQRGKRGYTSEGIVCITCLLVFSEKKQWKIIKYLIFTYLIFLYVVSFFVISSLCQEVLTYYNNNY